MYIIKANIDLDKLISNVQYAHIKYIINFEFKL